MAFPRFLSSNETEDARDRAEEVRVAQIVQSGMESAFYEEFIVPFLEASIANAQGLYEETDDPIRSAKLKGVILANKGMRRWLETSLEEANETLSAVTTEGEFEE